MSAYITLIRNKIGNKKYTPYLQSWCLKDVARPSIFCIDEYIAKSGHIKIATHYLLPSIGRAEVAFKTAYNMISPASVNRRHL